MPQQSISASRIGLGVVLGIVILFLASVSLSLLSFADQIPHAQESARKATCQTHMKEIGLAFLMYINDYNDVLPSSAVSGASDRSFRGTLGRIPPPKSKGYRGKTIFELLYPYNHTKDKDIYFCPSDPTANITRGIWFFKKTVPITSFKPSAPTSYVLRKCINQAWLDPKIKARKETDYNWPADQITFFERSDYHWSGASGDVSDPKNMKKQGVTVNCAFLDGHVKTVRLPMVNDGEPDYYNTDGNTGNPAKRPEIDPRRYYDTLR
jgi:prepilin-type processing-associated H-X9-DG protein